MSDDQLFRLILLAGLVIVMPIGIYHRLKSRTGEKLDRRQEGLFILITLRVVIRTRKEEENLIARFGDDYRKYMQRTGRFVPRL
jgi:protein-S-isoprenylcysteine O-methyltransferase Ste14